MLTSADLGHFLLPLRSKDTVDLCFEDLGLKKEIISAVKEQGYQKPTLIQSKAIPLILKGIDLLATAQTGTGKTASFSLPIIDRLAEFSSISSSPALHPVRALILTPTRELADQVNRNIISYAKNTNLRSAVIYGGVDLRSQVQILQKGVEIVTATPGRLLDHLEQKNIYLSQVQILVLDEADRMLDMGFMPDLKKIISLLPCKRQNLLFSATFSSELRSLAQRYMPNHEILEMSEPNSVTSLVNQSFLDIGETSKEDALCYLLERQIINQAIIFCNTRQTTNQLTRFLQSKKFLASSIHGNKTQAERMKTLESFKQRKIALLIATDVAARGIDVASLPTVINFDLPFSAEDYVHRIGRTGRAGLTGQAFSLVHNSEYSRLHEIAVILQQEISMIKFAIPSPQVAKSKAWISDEFVFYEKKIDQNSQERKLDSIFFQPYTSSIYSRNTRLPKDEVKQVKSDRGGVDKQNVSLGKLGNPIKREKQKIPFLLGGEGKE